MPDAARGFAAGRCALYPAHRLKCPQRHQEANFKRLTAGKSLFLATETERSAHFLGATLRVVLIHSGGGHLIQSGSMILLHYKSSISMGTCACMSPVLQSAGEKTVVMVPVRRNQNGKTAKRLAASLLWYIG
jgi:hypothetical protein